MRGTDDIAHQNGNMDRITPAHAGNSGGMGPHGLLLKDHPRPCGEQYWQKPLRKGRTGSPPPMRGTVYSDGGLPHPDGITPAHAGNSRLFSPQLHSQKDHPRPCGEQQVDRDGKAYKTGSPPPMRGTVSRWVWQKNINRITPAHAGNSHTRAADVV